jgi:hypothetical protein
VIVVSSLFVVLSDGHFFFLCTHFGDGHFFFNVFALKMVVSFHKKKSYPFPPLHIVIIIQYDYIVITFGCFKFESALLD